MDKTLIIVGGGYLGIELAKALESAMNVTLVEPRQAFVHAPAMIRALVEPSILESALMPYEKLLSKGRVVQDRAVSIEDTGVTLSSGDHLDADYIVVATGSWNGIVFKPEGDDIEAFRAAHRDVYQKLQAANTVAIVGAGAVGTELAGEIAHAMPDKKVTLISSAASLFPDLPPKLGASLA
ncbi:MAG: FAD-dependent oxidoreductase, partial [Cyanobacteria bacterium P01_H01_bin.119]